jgi:hypothetical protein
MLFIHMIKLMSRRNNQAGVINPLIVLIVVVLAGILVSANIPISREYLDGKNEVMGAHTSTGSPRVVMDGGQKGFIVATDGAITDFPLKVDEETGTLTVTTPSGEKVVAILPDAAIKNMLAAKVMSYVTSVKAEGELASTDKLVKLIEKDGVLLYEIDGVREHKLLGLIPLKSNVKAFVSAENGQVVKTEQSLLGRILSRIAP